MPLMKKSSKKALQHNIEAEMHAGKPQNQSLAIAYDIQRRNKKKMAKGGLVERDIKPTVDSRDSMEMDMEKDPMSMHKERKAAMDMADTHSDDNMSFSKKPRMEMHDEYKQQMSDINKDEMEFQRKPKMESHGLYRQHMSDVDSDEMDFQKKPMIQDHYEAQAGKDNDDSEMEMSDRIMRKRMAKGGMVDRQSVDLPAEEAEHSNAYYPINEHEVVGKEWASNSKDYSDSGMDGMDEDYHSPKDMDEDRPEIETDVVDHISQIMNRMHKRRARD